jgi:hypothetical protein
LQKFIRDVRWMLDSKRVRMTKVAESLKDIPVFYRFLIRTLSGSTIVKFPGKSFWVVLIASIKIRFSLPGDISFGNLATRIPE